MTEAYRLIPDLASKRICVVESGEFSPDFFFQKGNLLVPF